MLERLIIQNIALIDHLDIELAKGLNALTGETGAGKSIIIDSVNLVLGERASRELISSGKQKAKVEAVFRMDNLANTERIAKQLEQIGMELDEGYLTIMREITMSGKGLCRINGEIVSLNTLRSITDMLVDVHGQHEHQSLLSKDKHIAMIDSYNESEIAPVRRRVNELCKKYNELTSKLNSGFVSEAERERRIDILSYQINEINNASLSNDEENIINEEITFLSNSERINEALDKSCSLLSDENGSLDTLRKAVNALAQVSDLSAQYAGLYTRLDGLFYEVEDAAYQLREIRLGYEYSPERLDALQNRLDLINSMKRKYGGSVENVMDFCSKAQEELDSLIGSDTLRKELEKERTKTEKQYFIDAEKLTKLRRESALRLTSNVTQQVRELGMTKANFSASFAEPDGKLHPNGVDNAEFMLSANIGEPLKPLTKVASGGEISRIMLALKTVCANADGIPTLIFDEIDTGISGRTAVRVGEKMASVAKSHQVIAITHLPQIAAFADSHLLVEKLVEDDKTTTTLKTLSEDERRAELARIMGADGGDTAAKYAGELIAASRDFKAAL